MPETLLSQWNSKNPIAFVQNHLVSTHKNFLEDNPELTERITHHFKDFWEPYFTVYGSSKEQAPRLQALFDALIASYKNREPYLKEIDRSREEQPDWFQKPDRVGMMLYVDRFSQTLAELSEKISYFEELGVNYVHLMPLYKTRKGKDDGGYAVSSYRQIKPELGSREDLKKLSKKFHAHGISLVLDYPMNHTAIEHEWAQQALAGNKQYQQYYYMFDDRTIPDKYEETLPDVFPDFAPGNFTWQSDIEKWVWTSFYPFQWDLNYSNPEVFRRMFEELMSIINMGVDVVRLDAVPFLWKRMGTNCQNQPEAHYLLQAYRALVRMAAPGTIFKAEAIVAPDDIIKYLGVGGYENKECDLAYNATLMNHLWQALAAQNTRLLRTTLANLPSLPKTSSWINYIRCHDDIGWGISDENAEAIGENGFEIRKFCTDFYRGALPESYAEGYVFSRDKNTREARISGTAAALSGLQKAQIEANSTEKQLAIQRLQLLNSVIFSMKGIPVIYAGDEIGQLNDFSYLTDHYKKFDNRWVHRPAMDWEKAELRHQYGTVEHQLFTGSQRLINCRKTIEAFHTRSDDEIFDIPVESLFAVERSYNQCEVLLLSNFSESSIRFPISQLPGKWKAPLFWDRMEDANLHFSFQEITLPGYGFLWLSPTDKAVRKNLINQNISVEMQTQWGEEVYMVGNIKELGSWNTANAIGPFNADDYPIWKSTLEVPEHTVFEYKFIKKRNEYVVWESPETDWMRTYGG